MKKIILIFCILFTSACGIVSSAKTPVENYLNSYINLEYEVMLDLEKVIEEENLSTDQSQLYRDILKKQYTDLKYEIISENYDANEAVVKVKITVYDYYNAEKSSAEYLKENPNVFHDEDGVYSNYLYMDYKLNNIKKVTNTVDYEIDFNVTMENDIWKLNEITSDTLEKIHGVYNYEE